MKSYRVEASVGPLDWSRAEALGDFAFPWEPTPPPRTEFRALCRDERLHFRFDCDDPVLVLADGANVKERVLGSDRVEMFFTASLELNPYFCLEMDPRGNVYQYCARTYRRFEDTPWVDGLDLMANVTATGYSVEGSLPLAVLRSHGVLKRQSRELSAGIYRAEFSRNPAGDVHRGWMSWIDPGTSKPDFHVPSSFGKLVLPT
jgi:hypothetical protein